MKRCRASGPRVETHHDFRLGATGPRLFAWPGPFNALARTGPTVEKRLFCHCWTWLLTATYSCILY